MSEMNQARSENIQNPNALLWKCQHLLTVYLGASERFIRALFLANGGGVISVLAVLYKGVVFEFQFQFKPPQAAEKVHLHVTSSDICLS